MSEENKPEQQQQQQEVTITFTGNEEVVSITFADGVFQIPDYVVRGLGGADKLKTIAPALKSKNYQDFIAAFRTTIAKRDLNAFQAQIIANHFGRF